MKYNPGNPCDFLFSIAPQSSWKCIRLRLMMHVWWGWRGTAVTIMLFQLLTIVLNIPQVFTRLYLRVSYLWLFVDYSAPDSGVTLGASNQPRQPQPQSTMHAQMRTFSLHLCKLAEAMSLIPSDATSSQGCTVSYSCSAPQEPEPGVVLSKLQMLTWYLKAGFFILALNPDQRVSFCITEI